MLLFYATGIEIEGGLSLNESIFIKIRVQKYNFSLVTSCEGISPYQNIKNSK